MGAIGQRSFWDGFSITTNDDRYVDETGSYSSSSTTTYNPTYRTNGTGDEPVFNIFDDLDGRQPLERGSIPRRQMVGMAGTLNSFPRDIMDDPYGATNTFSDSNEVDEIELVTNMVDDMTKDDDMEDDFIEALNPNLVLPGTALQPDIQSSRWFPVS